MPERYEDLIDELAGIEGVTPPRRAAGPVNGWPAGVRVWLATIQAPGMFTGPATFMPLGPVDISSMFAGSARSWPGPAR